MLTSSLTASKPQVGSLQPVKPGADKFKARFTDGTAVMEGVLASQVGRRVIDGEIGDLDVLKLTDYMCNELKGAPIVIATAVEIVARGQAPLHAEVRHRSASPGSVPGITQLRLAMGQQL